MGILARAIGLVWDDLVRFADGDRGVRMKVGDVALVFVRKHKERGRESEGITFLCGAFINTARTRRAAEINLALAVATANKSPLCKQSGNMVLA